MPANQAEMPVVRFDREPPTANKGSVCPVGHNYRDCIAFCSKGPRACFMCGWSDGWSDGWDDHRTDIDGITRDEAYEHEERTGGMD